jgi:hypothetical protein
MPIIIYRVTCKMTNKTYIGNMQQHFKMRVRGHFQDVKKLMETGVHSDSYARHFMGIWLRGAATPSPGMQRDMIKCEILWKRNPIFCGENNLEKQPALCATEKEWRLSKSPDQPPIYLSTPAQQRYIAGHADTNQGSIGTMNRKPPVLMITRSVKKSTWKLRIPQEEESI